MKIERIPWDDSGDSDVCVSEDDKESLPKNDQSSSSVASEGTLPHHIT